LTAAVAAAGWLLLLAWAAAAVLLGRGLPRVRDLRAATEPFEPFPAGAAPPVSAVVPARDEAAALEGAIRSLLGQDYPALEVVAVDDRSTDETPAILARLAAADPRLVVLRVERIPEAPGGGPAWLGKPHALHAGAARATGEWLLFCDADVVHAPTAVSRAMRVALRDGRDHVTLLPLVESTGRLHHAFLAFFALTLLLARRVWDVPDPGSGASVGVGAFNLVRRALYDRFGGHAALRLEVVDDMALGQEAKRAGGRSEAFFSDGLLALRWYGSVRETVAGLTKNGFAAFGYSVPGAVAGVVLQAALGLGPYLGLLLAPGAARLPFLLAVLGITAGFAVYGRRAPGQATLLDGLLFPVATLLSITIVVRSTWVTLARGGVEWRGTRYPLARLRTGSRFGLGVRSRSCRSPIDQNKA
jgi:hypothetical protein